jgi:hypothetical protein
MEIGSLDDIDVPARLTRDFERLAATVAAFIRLAMIRLMLKRLTKPTSCS